MDWWMYVCMYERRHVCMYQKRCCWLCVVNYDDHVSSSILVSCILLLLYSMTIRCWCCHRYLLSFMLMSLLRASILGFAWPLLVAACPPPLSCPTPLHSPVPSCYTCCIQEHQQASTMIRNITTKNKMIRMIKYNNTRGWKWSPANLHTYMHIYTYI